MNQIPYKASLFGVPAPIAVPTPDTWTRLDEWHENLGDLASIVTAFGGDPRADVLQWSPDGTRLTLSSSGQDTIRTFSCDPFDPGTAVSLAVRNVSNSKHFHYNSAGTLCYFERTTDTYVSLACTNFTINSNAEGENMTKSERGFTGSNDQSYYPAHDLSFVYADGRSTLSGSAVRAHEINWVGGAGDFDNPLIPGPDRALNWTQNGSIIGTRISKDGLTILRGKGSSGIEVLRMSSPYDISTLTSLGDFAPGGDGSGVTRPDSVWINPNDTTEAWVCDNANGGFSLFRYATNV